MESAQFCGNFVDSQLSLRQRPTLASSSRGSFSFPDSAPCPVQGSSCRSQLVVSLDRVSWRPGGLLQVVEAHSRRGVGRGGRTGALVLFGTPYLGARDHRLDMQVEAALQELMEAELHGLMEQAQALEGSGSSLRRCRPPSPPTRRGNMTRCQVRNLGRRWHRAVQHARKRKGKRR